MASKTGRMAGIAIFIAVIVVLQVIATFVKIGSVPLNLTLVPIIVGAAMYGPKAGAVLGTTFGLVVVFFSITGADPGGASLLAINPVVAVLLFLLKGTLAGLAAGGIYVLLSKKNVYLGVAAAAIASPVVNTGILIAGLGLFFRDLLTELAGGVSLLYFAIVGLVGINFLIELGINIVLSPAIMRILKAVKKA